MEVVEETKPQKRPKDVVTLETEIPALPPKSERLAAPDEEKHERQVKNIEKEVAKLRAQRTAIQDLITEKKEGGKVENKDMSAKQYLDSRMNSRKDWSKDLKKFRGQLDILKEEFYRLVEDNKKIKTKIQIFDEADIDASIEEIELRLETTTMPLVEEKKLIQKLGTLKQSKPLVTEFKARSTRIDQNKKEQAVIKEQIDKLKSQVTSASTEIEDSYNKMKDAKEKLKTEIPALFEEKKKLAEDIEVLQAKRKQVIDDYHTKKGAYMDQKRQIKYIEWATKIQTMLKEKEERRVAQEEYEKMMELNKPHPYEKEITQCETFIAYLKRFAPEKQEENKGEETKIASDAGFEAPKEVKGAKESEQWFGQAKKKTKKKRERAGRGKETESILNLPIELLNFFSFTGIKVPTKNEELPEIIDELQKKRDHFESLEEREERKPEHTGEKRAQKVKHEQSEFKATDFPAPLESSVKVEYGIFKDEGFTPKKEEVKPTRGGRRGFRRGGN